jgi:3-dehydroquinate dehydratase/shikimate dehydrogenase
MLAVTVASTSPRLAQIELQAAATHGSLVELRLDRMRQPPDLPALLAAKKCPVIVSCRRTQDGGEWQRSEESRRDLLREAADAGADYIEIELDVAANLTRCGSAKRLISFTALADPSANLADVQQEAFDRDADAVRIAAPAPTLDRAWPLLNVIARQEKPTIGVGIGRAATMVAVLAAKLGSPWSYAVVDSTSATFDGQPTVHELDKLLHISAIDPTAPLVGVTGISAPRLALVGAINAAFARLGTKCRCVPLELDDIHNVARALDAFTLMGLVLAPAHRTGICELLEQGDLLSPLGPTPGGSADNAAWIEDCEELAKRTGQAELLVNHGGRWAGLNTTWRTAAEAMSPLIKSSAGAKRLIEDRRVLLLGGSSSAQAIAYAVTREGANLAICAPDRNRAADLAERVGCRPLTVDQLRLVDPQVLIATDGGPDADGGWSAVHDRLNEETVVLDLSRPPLDTPLIEAAWSRGCRVVDPLDALVAEIDCIVRAFTGKPAPLGELGDVLTGLKTAALAAPPAAAPPPEFVTPAAPTPAASLPQLEESPAAEPASPLFDLLSDEPSGVAPRVEAAEPASAADLPLLSDSASGPLPELVSLPRDEVEFRPPRPVRVDVQPPARAAVYDVVPAPPPPPPRKKWWLVQVGGAVVNWVWLMWVTLLGGTGLYIAVKVLALIAKWLDEQGRPAS